MGRRSFASLYDSRLANQSNLELFENQWAQGFHVAVGAACPAGARLQPTETSETEKQPLQASRLSLKI